MSVCDKPECCEAFGVADRQFFRLLHQAHNPDIQALNILYSETIVKHIIECRGHIKFLEEVAAALEKDLAQLTLILRDYLAFTYCLGMILTECAVSDDNYDRLLNCVPVLGNILLNFSNAKGVGAAEILKDNIKLSLLKDFIYCFSNIDHIRLLVPVRTSFLEFRLRDLEEFMAAGELLHETIVNLCAELRVQEEKIWEYLPRYKRESTDYEPFVSVCTTVSNLLSGPEVKGYDYEYNTSWKLYDYDKDKEVLSDSRKILPSTITRYREEQGSNMYSMPMRELHRLLDLSCQYGFPIYIDGRK